MAIIRLAAIAGLAGFTAFFWLDRLGGMLGAKRDPTIEPLGTLAA